MTTNRQEKHAKVHTFRAMYTDTFSQLDRAPRKIEHKIVEHLAKNGVFIMKEFTLSG